MLYNTSGKDANASIVERVALDLPFVVDYTAYWYASDNLDECYYLTMFLNGAFANEAMKPFQARGLFGPRHVCKNILEVPLARYKPDNSAHVRLAELGRLCAEKGKAFVGDHRGAIEGLKLGKLRLDLRAHLKAELDEGDALLAADLT